MRTLWFCLLIGLCPAVAHAVTVRLDMRPGIAGNAEYLPGKPDQPAVLLLHGFLQTRDFPTVATLSRGLHDAGYSVLAPTLSLGIPNRSQSLACEAIHHHRFEDDVAEIARWVGWLKARGHHAILLAGHSFGSLQLLAYLNTQPDPAVRGYVGTSLVAAQVGNTDRVALIAHLEKQKLYKQPALVSHSLSFCKKYLAPPGALLSYVRWDQPRTLQALKQSPVEMRLIMGDADTIVGRGWLKALRHVGATLVVVKGANHFMDGEHEFDLLDQALIALRHFDSKPSP